MRESGVARVGGCALVVLLALSGPARAEDMRGRWSFSFGFGVHSTFDDIRNNSGVVFSCDVDDDDCDGLVDGTNEPVDGELSNDRIVGFDPRTDDLLARLTKVEEKQRFDFSASYGLTSWLSLQVDTGLYRGDVAPLDVLVLTERWSQQLGSTSPLDAQAVTEPVSMPLTVGELTQIPVSINAVIRFRRDSPFNPFLGVGVGYLFNDLEENGSFRDLNNRILRGFNRVMKVPTSEAAGDGLLNLQQIFAGFVALENQSGELPANFIYDVDCTAVAPGSGDLSNACTSFDTEPRRLAALPRQPFIQTEVSDAFMYQFMVGADYQFNERWAAFVSARYQVTDAKVSVKIRGVDPQRGAFELDEATFRYIAETNPVPLNPENFPEGRFERTEVVAGADPARARTDTLQERVLVQGGEIDLSAFTIGAGIRFTF